MKVGSNVATIPSPAFSRQTRPRETRADAQSTRLARLARSGVRVAAAPRTTRLPYLERADELGDVARAIQALQEIAAERDVLEAMIRQVPIGIALIGPDGRYRSVNPTYATMHGHRDPE